MAAPGQGHLGKPLERHDTRSALSRHPKRTHRQPLPVEKDLQHAKNTYSDRGRNLNKSPGARNRTNADNGTKIRAFAAQGGSTWDIELTCITKHPSVFASCGPKQVYGDQVLIPKYGLL